LARLRAARPGAMRLRNAQGDHAGTPVMLPCEFY
jgi:hypothetical protein